MPRDAVILDEEAARRVVCLSLVEALAHYGCVVEEACMTPVHAHALVRFPTMGEVVRGVNAKNPATGVAGLCARTGADPGNVWCELSREEAQKIQRMLKGNSLQDGRDPIPRVILGKAKSWAATQLAKAGFIVRGEGGLWAVRSKEEPVNDFGHWTYTSRYIKDHVEERGVARACRVTMPNDVAETHRRTAAQRRT
jgi:hypothetical protein